MLIVSSIRLMLDLSVFRVPRPCLYMLGSSSQPKYFACVNIAYTHCMRMLESITPNHHVVLRNNELSQRCTVRGNTFLKFYEGSSYLCYRRSKQIRCKHDKHHMQIIKWHDMANIILRFWSPSSKRGMITFVTGMTPWSPSSCLHKVISPTITSTTMANS